MGRPLRYALLAWAAALAFFGSLVAVLEVVHAITGSESKAEAAALFWLFACVAAVGGYIFGRCSPSTAVTGGDDAG